MGRGTRIDEEHNKYFFTIMDFKKATELFNDPDFDGEPVVIYEPGDGDDPVPPDPEPGDGEDDDDDEENDGVQKFNVSGVEVFIVAERVQYYGPDGHLVTESYKEYSRNHIRKEYSTLDAFLNKWNSTKRKDAIIKELEEYGIEMNKLALEVGTEYSDFDLICHIAYDQPPLTRSERANNVKKRNYFTKYGEQARAVLEALLEKYASEGITAIESPHILKLRPFIDMGTPMEIINNAFGGKIQYENAIQELEQELFLRKKSA